MHDDRLLREYVRQVLKEDDAGNFAAGAADAYGPQPIQRGVVYKGRPTYGGPAIASKEELWNSFIKPFTDVYDVAKGKTKETMVKAQTVLKATLQGILSTIVPAFEADYQKIFQAEKKKLDAVKREYKDVYDATYKAFNNSDAKFLAFLYDPFAAGAMIAYFGGKAGARKAVDVADIISGGALANFKAKIDAKLGPGPSAPVTQNGSTDESRQFLVKEASIKQLIGTALETQRAKQMQQKARKLVQATLTDIVTQVQKVEATTRLESLPIKLPQDTLQKLQAIPEAERGPAEAEMLKSVKRAIGSLAYTNVQRQLSAAQQAGVPNSSQYIKDYQNVANKLKRYA